MKGLEENERMDREIERVINRYKCTCHYTSG